MHPNHVVTDVAMEVGSLLCLKCGSKAQQSAVPGTAWSSASAKVPELRNLVSFLVV